MKDIFEGAGLPLDQAGFDSALGQVGGDKASLWSILRVETKGFGFFADRRPKILYERHIFHGRTGGRFSARYPDLSNSEPGGYLSGINEYSRLKRAMLLDRRAALESVSWGLGQVMGFNAAKIGYDDVERMISEFSANESSQLMGCASFIRATPALLKAYRDRQWEKVAFFYNGKNYAINAYDTKLEAAYKEFSGGLPDIGVRAAQAYLTYLNLNPKGIDGVVGNGTLAALDAFRAGYGLKGELPAQEQLQRTGSTQYVSAHLPSLSKAFTLQGNPR